MVIDTAECQISFARDMGASKDHPAGLEIGNLLIARQENLEVFEHIACLDSARREVNIVHERRHALTKCVHFVPVLIDDNICDRKI